MAAHKNVTGSLYGIVPGTLANGKAVILDSDGRLRGSFIHDSSDHFAIRSTADGKNVRINSRNYPSTSGDASGVQIKPQRSVTGTASITGLEVSPRFAAGVAGGGIVAIKADPVLKDGLGDLTGGVVAVQANIDLGEGAGRIIAGDISAFESFLQITSVNYTYSGDISFLRVRTVNAKGWDQFLNLDDGNTGVDTASNPSAATQDRWMRVMVGSTQYYLRLYTA